MNEEEIPRAEYKTYMARCHCAATIFTVTIPPLESGLGASRICECNCSICMKSGYLLCYPKREDVKFLKGEAELKSYLFGQKTKPQRFCGECGTSILIDFGGLPEGNKAKGLLAVSIRTFDGIEDLLNKCVIEKFDGKHRISPPYAGVEIEA